MLDTLLTWKILAPATVLGLVIFCTYYPQYWRRWRLPFFMGGCFGTQKKAKTKRTSSTNGSPGYLGLRNEGSTCYLNSILQCLFMAPDFTDILSRPEDPSSQHVKVFRDLFHRLQQECSPPSTLDLMRCFGIEEGRQQDVEEHFRILINSLPQEFQQLFRIHMVHSLTCKGCKNEDIMQNPMLCLPLAIKDRQPSVNEALHDFQEENVLNLDNQCYCSVCKRKEDASSRHYFTALPKILVVHLKRYGIYHGRFEKISESVSVPYSLTVPVEKSQVASTADTRQDFTTVDMGEPGEHQQHKHQASTADTRQDFTTVDMGEPGEHQQHKHQDSVEYTLFALCNHYGGLRGGHYTAEIMSSNNKQWYTFDDTRVMDMVPRSKETKIHSGSAYLLMYYQKQEQPKFPEKDDLPSDIQSSSINFL